MIKIFAVDDDLHLLETIIIQIEQEGGYDIEGASSLKKAKAKLADVDPDLVILDVTLGDGDGRDFCRWMMKRPANWPKPPTYLLTEVTHAI